VKPRPITEEQRKAWEANEQARKALLAELKYRGLA
jgi:hypothetical protein